MYHRILSSNKRASQVVLVVKEPTCQCKRHDHRFDPWGREDPLEEDLENHSSILAWRIPRTEEPGRLQSTGSQRVRHD